jgi:release factor glutamine methyltransferase
LSAIGGADIVLANLPYIPSHDIASLQPEVRDWEPRVALDGGEDGLGLVRPLIEDCANRLRPRLLAMEVGQGQAPLVAAFGRERGARVEIHKDLVGIDRVVCLRWA